MKLGKRILKPRPSRVVADARLNQHGVKRVYDGMTLASLQTSDL